MPGVLDFGLKYGRRRQGAVATLSLEIYWGTQFINLGQDFW